MQLFVEGLQLSEEGRYVLLEALRLVPRSPVGARVRVTCTPDDIYNNFDLCWSIFFPLYIKCGSYLLVELMYLFIRNVVCECNFAF